MKKLTVQERIAAAKEVYAANGTFTDLAHKLGVSVNYARSIAIEANVNLSHRRLTTPKSAIHDQRRAERRARFDRAIELLKEGKSAEAVAEEVDVHPTTIRSWATFMGVLLAKRRVPRHKARTWVCNSIPMRVLAHLFHHPGDTQAAVLFGCSSQYVKQVAQFMEENNIRK